MNIIQILKFPCTLWAAYRLRHLIYTIIDQVHQASGKPTDEYKIKISCGVSGSQFSLIGGNDQTVEIFNACIRIVNMSTDDKTKLML